MPGDPRAGPAALLGPPAATSALQNVSFGSQAFQNLMVLEEIWRVCEVL
jgi:hypothetical protein